MKLLVVSWYMPPFNTMGALRVGKFCKYLHQQGHDVRVLSCANLPYDRTLTLEFPEERILRTGSVDVNALPKAVQRLRVALRRHPPEAKATGAAPAAPEASPAPAARTDAPPGLGARILRALRVAFTETLSFPDPQVGWLWPGIRGGRRLLAGWTPDLILASAPPFTTLLIARSLSRRSGAPLIVEYRDRFFEDPYSPPTRLRKRLERRAEDWWMKPVRGIVTVSEPWAQDYRARFGLPVCTVYNGFDPDEYPQDVPDTPSDPAVLDILYTGVLYPDRRDPSPLFAAIARLGEDARHVRVTFFGAERDMLTAMAGRHGVLDRVEINGRIPYAESVARQMSADVLLLLQWNDPSEQGNVPGKVFEYLAARRPILGIGLEDGVPARIIRERGAGVYANDPVAIEAQLRAWIEQKRRDGGIARLSGAVRDGFSRPEQYARLTAFLEDFLPGGHAAGG